MKSMTQKVAEFCMNGNGATRRDIANRFNIDPETAHGAMRAVMTGGRYEKTQTKEGNKIRLKVTKIRDSHEGAMVAVVAKNIISGEEIRFKSLVDADVIGGFSPCNIRKCINGVQSSHAGYYWKRA